MRKPQFRKTYVLNVHCGIIVWSTDFQKKRIQGIYTTEIFTQIYYKKLAPTIAKAGKSQEQQSECWRPRRPKRNDYIVSVR